MSCFWIGLVVEMFLLLSEKASRGKPPCPFDPRSLRYLNSLSTGDQVSYIPRSRNQRSIQQTLCSRCSSQRKKYKAWPLKKRTLSVLLGFAQCMSVQYVSSQHRKQESSIFGILYEDLFLKKDFIYLLLKRGEWRGRREGERKRSSNVLEKHRSVASCMPSTAPATQACALTENRTSNLYAGSQASTQSTEPDQPGRGV